MRATRPGRTSIVVAIVVALGLIWVAGLWYFEPWVAHNDFAVFRLRLERVLGGEPGLLGAHSRLEVSHPGPAREWLFAVPYWVSGRRAASLPSTALVVNMAFVLAILVMAWRRRRQWIGVIAATGGALVLIAMRDQLDSPWNPHLAVLPLFAATVATVLVLDGSRRAWVVAVVGACLAGQLHASALAVAGALFVVVLIGEARRDPERWWRPVALGAALWIGPILDLLRGSEANLVRLLTVEAGERVGPMDALAHVSRLTWPWSIFEARAIEPTISLFVGWSRWWLLVVVGAIVVGVRRPGDGLCRASVVALVAVAGAIVSISAFVEPSYRYLYGPLQAVAAFAFVTAVAVVVDRLAGDLGATRPALGTTAAIIPVVVLVGSLAMTSRHDHESAARADLALEEAVDRHLRAHPDWDTVTLLGLDVTAANPVAELADVLVRRDLDPRSNRPELDMTAPDGGGDAYVVAMGPALRCLTESGVEPLAQGIVPSVDAPIGLFAIDLDAEDRSVSCIAAATQM